MSSTPPNIITNQWEIWVDTDYLPKNPANKYVAAPGRYNFNIPEDQSITIDTTNQPTDCGNCIYIAIHGQSCRPISDTFYT